MFRKNEHIPKMHVFRDGIKELDLEELQQINKNIILKAKSNNIYRRGTIDNLVVGIDGVLLGYEKVTSEGLKGKQEYEPNVAIKLIKN